jgi:tRNA nucleotidyltransferase (CCA-adding enzyme)
MEMQIWLVGGAVRDRLMGVKEKDLDFVVVGSTPEDMKRMGFKQVGEDFPIFINGSGAEFSLARRSRKGGVADFGPEVTLADDLLKRDLTINAIACPYVGDPSYFDPFHGQDDIVRKVLRMVRPSSFMEDPIRILRVARFAARFPDWTVDPDTMDLMCLMVERGMTDNLVPERVWKEISRGLMENKPSRMLDVLRQCGALKVILPEVDGLFGVTQPVQHHPEIDTYLHVCQVLDYAASQNYSLPVRFAAMLHDVGKGLTPKNEWPAHHGHEGRGVPLVESICERLRVPSYERQLAVTAAREHGNIHSAMAVKTTTIVRILRRCDAFRNPGRFEELLQVALCDARGRIGEGDLGDFSNVAYPQADRYRNALVAAQSVDGGAVAAQVGNRPEFIPTAIHAARARAIRKAEHEGKKKQEQEIQ